MRLKPGKPAVFARLGKTLVFGLPGNPVSAAVTFHLFVRKAILKMQVPGNKINGRICRLEADAKAAKKRPYLQHASPPMETRQIDRAPLRWQGSSDFVGFAHGEFAHLCPAR